MPKGVYSRTAEANKINSLSKIGLKKSPLTEEHKEKLRLIMTGKKMPPRTPEYCKKLSESKLGKPKPPRTEEHCCNLSLALLGKSNGPQTPEQKKTKRIAALEYIRKTNGKIFCFIGKNEKDLLDLQEMLFGIKIDRQFEILNLGYSCDGYDIKNNCVYEVYESAHLKTRNKVRDLQRQKEIQEHLGCDFKIIWDLYENESRKFLREHGFMEYKNIVGLGIKNKGIL